MSPKNMISGMLSSLVLAAFEFIKPGNAFLPGPSGQLQMLLAFSKNPSFPPKDALFPLLTLWHILF